MVFVHPVYFEHNGQILQIRFQSWVLQWVQSLSCTKIENQIHQTKNIARQDAINYGIKVNNRLAFLLADQQLGDFPPTNQAEEVYDVLAKELDGYLNQLKPLIKTGVETLNAEAQKRQIPLLKEKG